MRDVQRCDTRWPSVIARSFIYPSSTGRWKDRILIYWPRLFSVGGLDVLQKKKRRLMNIGSKNEAQIYTSSTKRSTYAGPYPYQRFAEQTFLPHVMYILEVEIIDRRSGAVVENA